MIFQKPVFKKKANILDVAGYTLVIAILSAYLTYGTLVLYGLGGNKGDTTALDIFEGLAAIATASAFFLGLLQYRKSTNQHRQQTIAAEAKNLIDKMINAASQIKTGSDTCVESLDRSLTDLHNFATGFYSLYEALDEDIERAIIRVRWQDMYYVHLQPALLALDLIELLSKDAVIDPEELNSLNAMWTFQVNRDGTPPDYKKFALYEGILDSPQLSKYDLRSKLQSLDGFIIHFMNKYTTNDLMYGIANHIDIRSHAPLLAAAKPSEYAFHDLRGKDKAI